MKTKSNPSSHVFNENNIPLPAVLRVVSAEEWRSMRKYFGEIGYCCFTSTGVLACLMRLKPEKQKDL